LISTVFWLALAAVSFSCFFAACSSALRIFSKSKLEDLLEKRGQADRFDRFIEQSSKLLLMTGTLRATLSLVVLLSILYMFETATDAPSELWLKYVVSFVVTGLIISVFAVAIPVSVARYHPEKLLVRSMPLLNACLTVFMPVASLLDLLDPIVRRLTGSENEAVDVDERLTEEILSVVEDHNADAAVDEDQKDMLEGVIELRSTTAGQIMTPRIDVKGIEQQATLEQVKATILDLGHSRMPVYGENLDQIVGILYAKDMIRYIANGQPWEMDAVLREAFMVPESKPVADLLSDFKKLKVHMAIVLDEYGGTAGLVTIEDILEEIVGEIHDEYEPAGDDTSIRRIDDRIVEVDARVYIDDLNDELDLKLPEDDGYDTVGGFVFSSLGHIPEEGESFEFGNVRVTVTAATRTKVDRIRVEMLEVPGNGGNGGQ